MKRLENEEKLRKRRYASRAPRKLPKLLGNKHAAGNIPWNKGILMPKETKEKVSRAKKANPTRYWLGKKRDEDTARKLRSARVGKPGWGKGEKRPLLSGKNNPRWSRVKMSCKRCGVQFERKRCTTQELCSIPCKNDWLRENKINSGKNSATWQGGKSRDGHTNYFKKVVSPRLRGKYPCLSCGTKKDLVVHHVDLNKKNDKMTNLRVLCRSHHSTFHNIIREFSK